MNDLTNSELICKLLSRKASKLGDIILSKCDNSLLQVERYIETLDIKGLTNASRNIIRCVFELARRIEEEEKRFSMSKEKITNSNMVFEIMSSYMSSLDHEEVWAVYSSNGGKVLAKKLISIGSVHSSVFDPKTVMYHAIVLHATNVVLCHNHPHSSTSPSRNDREVTDCLKKALKLLDCRLVDHIIISDNRYYSFSDNGEI